MDSELNSFIELCRVCLNRNKDARQLFDSGTNNLAEKITFCTGVEFTKEEGMPTLICEPCYNDLEVAYRFKTACQLAKETFHKLLESTIKQETVEPCDDFVNTVNLYDDFAIKDEPTVFIGDVTVKNHGNRISNKPYELKKKQFKSSSTNKEIKEKHVKGELKSLQELEKDMKKEKKILCQCCGTEFVSKKQLVEHKKELHKESWICEVCGKVFTSRASSYSHMQSHQPPKFECYACDYKTVFKHDLAKHIRIHTADKCFQCEMCTKSFRTISNLRDHTRRHHSEGPLPRRFACHLCEKRFYDRSKLTRHVDAHNNIMRYKCELCQAQFARRNYWTEHLLKQHGITMARCRPGRKKNDVPLSDQKRSSQALTDVS